MSEQSMRLALLNIAHIASGATNQQPRPVRSLLECRAVTLLRSLCDGTSDDEMHVFVPVRAVRVVLAGLEAGGGAPS